MKHLTRQVIAFSAGIGVVGALAIGGVALAQGDDEPVGKATDTTSQTTEHPLAAVTHLIECTDDQLVEAPEMFTVACADGTLETVPVRVTAGDLVHGEASQSYGTLTLDFPGEVPAGFGQGEVLELPGVEPMVPDLDQ